MKQTANSGPFQGLFLFAFFGLSETRFIKSPETICVFPLQGEDRKNGVPHTKTDYKL